MRLGILLIGRYNDYGQPSYLYKEGETDLSKEEAVVAIVKALEESAKADTHYQLGLPCYDDMIQDGFSIKTDISKAEELAVVQWTHQYIPGIRMWELSISIRLGDLRYDGKVLGTNKGAVA